MLAGFIAFFMLAYTLGLGAHNELRFFNCFIQLFFIYKAITSYYKLHPENIGNYMMGVVQGMGTTVIGVGGFALFMAVFLSINPPFMQTIRENSSMEPYLSPMTACLFILTEGVVIGLIGAYILTRVLDVAIEEA